MNEFITLNGETIALCLAAPNWEQPIVVELTLPATVERSLSADESRRVFASSVRYELEYKALFPTAADSTDFRVWLNRLKGELVAVPMWTDQVELSCEVPRPSPRRGCDLPLQALVAGPLSPARTLR